jgi:hypothetical protein
MPLTPRLDHDGGRTLWKMVGTPENVQAVKLVIEEKTRASVQLLTESQTPEQDNLRRAMLGLPPH